jgi:hypothetical protein
MLLKSVVTPSTSMRVLIIITLLMPIPIMAEGDEPIGIIMQIGLKSPPASDDPEGLFQTEIDGDQDIRLSD